MFVYPYILISTLLPVIFFLLLLRNKNFFTYNWFVWFIAFLLCFIFIYQAGAWPYIGYAVRYILALLFAVIYFFFYRKYKKYKGRKKNSAIAGIIATVFCSVFAFANYEIIRSTHSDLKGIELSFPLAEGTYAIQQGGNSKLTNAAHRSRIEYSFAYDIIKLNDKGMRGSKIFSKEIKDYAIYGDTVVSPCDCKVVSVRNSIEENIPPYMNETDRGGNYVILQKDDVRIILCHMQKNSVRVKEGQKLKTGTPLGLVGNTGFSIEPHLHMQAYKKSIRGRDQVPIRFNGKILKLNDVVNN
ncbi:MAG: M23 family metallopeptidase [Fimbriimonadaceae bacterium]|nr:M23 family metallopeptidase [Chitinophagales bacterium]